jgi:hypothetical protein
MLIDGLDEEFHTEYEEPNSHLILDIRNCASLADCLNLMHSTNYFRGRDQYFADTLRRKINAKGCAWLSSLPNHLITDSKGSNSTIRL